MHHEPDTGPDPLEHLLAAPPLPPDGGALKGKLLARTTRRLRNQRRLRRVAWALALAGCYAAGLLTTRWLPSPRPPVVAERLEDEPRPEETPVREEERSAVAVEWRALEGEGE